MGRIEHAAEPRSEGERNGEAVGHADDDVPDEPGIGRGRTSGRIGLDGHRKVFVVKVSFIGRRWCGKDRGGNYINDGSICVMIGDQNRRTL